MARHTFTLIFGAYDHERYVEQAVRSVQAQTAPFDRIIFFSDGSKDGTLPLARSLLGSDPRVTWLDDLEANRGLVPRLRDAVSRIDGGYVCALAADDALDPGACQTFRELAERTSFEWAMGATQMTDGDFHPTRLVDPTVLEGETPGRMFERMLKLDPWVPTQGWCYSVEFLRRVGGYDSRYAAEDYSLGLRFLRGARPALTSRLIGYYRVLDASWSRGPRAERMWREHASVALDFFRSAPRAALSAASTFRLTAAAVAWQNGARRSALWHGLVSALLYPEPVRTLGNVRALLRELGRVGRARNEGSLPESALIEDPRRRSR